MREKMLQGSMYITVYVNTHTHIYIYEYLDTHIGILVYKWYLLIR